MVLLISVLMVVELVLAAVWLRWWSYGCEYGAFASV